MQFRASASLLIIVILSLGSFISQSMPVVAKRAAGNTHSPVLPMQAASAMTDTAHTSPQFGYSVSWDSPWTMAGEPSSETGVGDFLQLTSGSNNLLYAGVFATASEKELVYTYLEALTEMQPDAHVVREFTGQSARLPMLVQYTEAGVPMTQVITTAPIERRESLLLIVHFLPSATSTKERGDLEELVTLDVSSRETASENPSITESGGSGAQQGVPTENDSEMVFEDVYTVPVYCEEVTGGAPFGRVVYGSCEWPVPILGSSAACIEDDSLVYQGLHYLCKPRGGDSGQAHPNEVTLQNAPERIYTMEVTCERVKDEFGITTEVCVWPWYMTGSPECIEDGPRWGNRSVYLCKP